MKTIIPISIWNNGSNKNGTIFNLICINDNMQNSAIFYFQLFSELFIELSSGNLTMNLPEYASDWVTNDAAYNWAAIQLGLTITGEYIPPAPVENIAQV